MVSADAEMQSPDINMEPAVLMMPVRLILGYINPARKRLIAIAVAKTVGLATEVSSMAVVGIRHLAVAAVAVTVTAMVETVTAMAVTVTALVSMMTAVATVKPIAGFGRRSDETESGNKCRNDEKTLHGSCPLREAEKVLKSNRDFLKLQIAYQTRNSGNSCRYRARAHSY